MKRRRRLSRDSAARSEGAILGRRLSGERALPLDAGRLVWPFAAMRRHALILGASGSGKTETAMQIADEVARKCGEAQIFYLDAKGDRGAAERFAALMDTAGRETRVFPNQPLDAWRGDWRGVANRLLEVIEFAAEGPAAYYRDIAKATLQLVCNHPDGPPRSSVELLARLDYERLLDTHGPTGAVLSLPRDGVSQTRMRFQAYFAQLGRALDGEWSWEDADAGYLLLDSVALGEDTAGAARMLFADFAHYFSQRKDRDRFCLLIVDEFAALAAASDVAVKIEQARGFNTGMVLVPQTPAGIGPRSQRERILGSVETVILHAVNEPEEITALAGTRQAIDLSHRYRDGAREADGFARQQRRPKIEASDVRALPCGSAWLIRRGRAAKLAVERAPHERRGALPPAAPLDPPLERAEVRMPRQIGYLGPEPEEG